MESVVANSNNYIAKKEDLYISNVTKPLFAARRTFTLKYIIGCIGFGLLFLKSLNGGVGLLK